MLFEKVDIITDEDGSEEEYIELLQSVIDADKQQLQKDISPFLRQFFEDRIADYEKRIDSIKSKLNNSQFTESVSRKHIDLAQKELEANPDCFCVFYGYQYKKQPVTEISPEAYDTEDAYENRVIQLLHSFDKIYPDRTIRAKMSDLQLYTLYNGNSLSEEVSHESTVKDEIRIEYGEFYIAQFDYTLTYSDKSVARTGVVLLHKNATDANGFNVVVFAEDEDGNEIDFKTIDEAKYWIDKYSDRIKFEIKHGDEIHATIESTEEN